MIAYVEATDRYRPGACNIGPAEIRRRRRIGYVGSLAAVGLGAALLAVDAPAVVRIAVALPAAVAVSGFLQARLRFCAGYGSQGLRNLGALGDAERVEGDEARAADRRKAAAIYATSVAAGSVIALLFVLL